MLNAQKRAVNTTLVVDLSAVDRDSRLGSRVGRHLPRSSFFERFRTCFRPPKPVPVRDPFKRRNVKRRKLRILTWHWPSICLRYIEIAYWVLEADVIFRDLLFSNDFERVFVLRSPSRFETTVVQMFRGTRSSLYHFSNSPELSLTRCTTLFETRSKGEMLNGANCAF